MTSARAKGLSYVREVKKILDSKGYRVEGPGYKPVWMGKGMRAVHSDYFGVFDLLAIRRGRIEGHQVSTLTNKATKIKAIQEGGLCGYVWCRISKDDYRIWYVYQTGQVEEVFEVNM